MGSADQRGGAGLIAAFSGMKGQPEASIIVDVCRKFACTRVATLGGLLLVSYSTLERPPPARRWWVREGTGQI